ncbi:hypothetical protein OSB04_011766 [Centaurea solstitialis]|uniref:Reverse transcriptase Ty1/copia-type domain-containing protein n=1 Tax=Centaurea solstitialis TaxID=347529 RepID=A0AA38WDA1_9ASTR|nr:hypothetical protein OSB04_011766 [Centaurea solstitialis]
MTTIRAFLAIAAAKKWELHRMDVQNAFLHGDLEEEVFMKPPPGFASSNPNLVCRLRKPLYGLKHPPPPVLVRKTRNGSKRLWIFAVLFRLLAFHLHTQLLEAPLVSFCANENIITEAGLLGAKPSGVPIEQNCNTPLKRKREV